MSKALSQLYRLTRNDVKRATEVFVRAFADDKLSQYMYPIENTREKAMRSYFRYRLTYGVLYGEVYAISPKIEGLAVWYRDNQYSMSYWRNFRAGGMKLLRYLDSDTMNRMMNLGRFTINLRKQCFSEPYWYLEPLGVDPDHQGKGFASILVRSMLKRIDSEHLLTVLETQTSKNVDIYKRYNFEIVKEVTIPDTAITHWLMARKARK
ncbi:MAG: GNAT family N-acetyltransferase [Candidatus Heimdallarchaeota archaeon]|nr:GNAT family N-acetyltransferase [Candidatus Heimdallarchaeota archaeon]